MKFPFKSVALIVTATGLLALGAGRAAAGTLPLPANANPTTPGVTINQTTCITPHICFAVGSYRDDSGQTQALIETEQDGSWSASEAPLPAGASASSQFAYLRSISCVAIFCVAVGDYADASGHRHGLIADYGISWGIWETYQADLSGLSSVAANPQVSLDSVSCVQLDCAVAGGYTDGANVRQALLGFDSGATGWTFTKTPLPSGAQAPTLSAIACPNSGSCEAVGEYQDATLAGQGLIVSGADATWTASKAPLPSDAVTGTDQVANLTSVACPSSTQCVAVGRYVAQHGTTEYPQGLTETGAGTSWAAQQASRPISGPLAADPYQSAALSAVDCEGTTDCGAVGYYTDTLGDIEGLIDTGAPGSMTGLTAPLPTGAESGGTQSAFLQSVSCPNSDWCAVTGSYQDAAKHTQGFVLTGADASWSAAEAQLPSGAASVSIDGLACVVRAQCVAAGAWGNASETIFQGITLGAPGATATPTVGIDGPSATVSFTPPRDTGGLPVTGYTVTATDLTNSSVGDQSVQLTATQRRASFGGLIVGDTYNFTVTATNAFGDGPAVASAALKIASTADLRASMSGLLHPSGNAAKIRTLRKSHGYRFTFAGLESGRVTVNWYHVTGTGKHKHRTLIATGTATTSPGARATLRVTLNGAGKRLLASVKRLPLSATAAFTAPGHTPISVSGSFTLRW